VEDDRRGVRERAVEVDAHARAARARARCHQRRAGADALGAVIAGGPRARVCGRSNGRGSRGGVEGRGCGVAADLAERGHERAPRGGVRLGGQRGLQRRGHLRRGQRRLAQLGGGGAAHGSVGVAQAAHQPGAHLVGGRAPRRHARQADPAARCGLAGARQGGVHRGRARAWQHARRRVADLLVAEDHRHQRGHVACARREAGIGQGGLDLGPAAGAAQRVLVRVMTRFSRRGRRRR
jgi:hypothetical protein